jgi:hypothetical protein
VRAWRWEKENPVGTKTWLRLSVLMILYFYPLYILSSRFYPLYSFLPHPSIIYIILYPLWDLLVTLSKYIHMRSCFKGFIKTNLVVQSKFNLVFWFVSYNILKLLEISSSSGAHVTCTMSPSHLTRTAAAVRPTSRTSSTSATDSVTGAILFFSVAFIGPRCNVFRPLSGIPDGVPHAGADSLTI